MNPGLTGTKAAWWYRCIVDGGGRAELRLRLHRPDPVAETPGRAEKSMPSTWAGADFDRTCAQRQTEADEFYLALSGGELDDERMRILRQAAAGLVWSKQFYAYRVARWLDEMCIRDRVRLLLRQASVRPPSTRRRRVDPTASRC